MKHRIWFAVLVLLFLPQTLEAHPLFDQVKADLEQNQYFQVDRVLQDYVAKNPRDDYTLQFSEFFDGLKQVELLFTQRLYAQAAQLYKGLYEKNYPSEWVDLLRTKTKYQEMQETLQEIERYSRGGDLDYLAGLYLKAANLNPRDTQWQQDAEYYKELSDLSFKARVLFRQSAFQEAYEIFNQIAQKLSEHGEMLEYRAVSYDLALAKDLYLKGFYEDAVELFNKSAARFPREEFLWGWKNNVNQALKLKKQAQAALERQSFDEARSGFSQILKINPVDANALAKIKEIEILKQNIQEGTQFLLQGKYSLALLYFNKAYKVQPGNKDLQQRISVCHRIMFYQSEGRKTFQAESLAKIKSYPELYQLVVQEILTEKQKKQASDD